MRASAVEMVKPSLYGQAIILLVYVPLLTFTGVEGKMFEPMALTVILALGAAFVLSLTLVPALIAISLTSRVQEERKPLRRGAEARLSPAVALRHGRAPSPVIAVAVVLFADRPVRFHQARPGVHPSLDEKNIAMHAIRIPSHGADPVAGDAVRGWRRRSAACRRSPSCSPRPVRPKWRAIRCRRTPPTHSSS